MRATIHQPYFIPWLGYFSKLCFSDVFIVLDNVQFRKRHYYDRTKFINMHGEVKWLSLPVGENFQKAISDVQVSTSDRNYVKRLERTLQLSYARAKWYAEEWNLLKYGIIAVLANNRELVKINVNIIVNILQLLDLSVPPIIFSSQLISDNYTDPTNRIIDICYQSGVTELVIGGGMSSKIHDWSRVSERGIKVYIQDYLKFHPKYSQVRRKRAGFQAGLSIVDAILNAGRGATRKFLTDAQYEPKLFVG